MIPNLTPADLVRKYLELRAYVEAATASFEESLKPYKAGLETIEGAIHKHLDDNGLDNIKTPDGTAFKKSGTRVRVKDRQVFFDFVKTQPNGLDMLAGNLVKEEVLKYVKEHETPPPGIDYVTYIGVQVRKA